MQTAAYMQVNAFIVKKGTPGMRTEKIENKISLRCVQNADIYLDGAEVDEADRLPGVESFKDTNKVMLNCCLLSSCLLSLACLLLHAIVRLLPDAGMTRHQASSS
jgi:alkylation response protein AidB-like acyl-CoA dehydrogenase